MTRGSKVTLTTWDRFSSGEVGYIVQSLSESPFDNRLCAYMTLGVFQVAKWYHPGFNPWVNPLELEMATHSCSRLKNSIDRGAWWATVLWGCKQSDTTEHAHAIYDPPHIKCGVTRELCRKSACHGA